MVLEVQFAANSTSTPCWPSTLKSVADCTPRFTPALHICASSTPGTPYVAPPSQLVCEQVLADKLTKLEREEDDDEGACPMTGADLAAQLLRLCEDEGLNHLRKAAVAYVRAGWGCCCFHAVCCSSGTVRYGTVRYGSSWAFQTGLL